MTSSDPVDELRARLQAALGDGYAVETPLGQGGFAVVFRVMDRSLRRPLAVKVMSPQLTGGGDALERMRREAETIAQLTHPNIVPLHFIGQKDDLFYLAMQMVAGGSLADRLEREPRLPVREATRIFAEIADALGYAHARGVVHRDIKPHNILLDETTGRALLTDFGIARAEGNANITTTGVVLGTPAYLSPEQVTGDVVDHRADIFSLGIVAYEMFAGSKPYDGPTAGAAMMKRLGAPPQRLDRVRSDAPKSVVAVVERCLVVNPEERLSSASEIAKALTGEIALPARPARTSTRIGVAAAGLAVAAIAIAAWTLKDAPPVAPPVAAVEPVDSGMVLIPAGSYRIGSDSGPPNAAPAHTVQLAAFGIGRTEVSIFEFARWVSVTGASAKYPLAVDPGLPVTGVTMPEAKAYCEWKHPDGGRLPTEQEWEAAARGTAGRLYAWGDEWNPDAATVGDSAPRPAGSRPLGRTPEGIEDMIGNVWEWTSSPFVPYGRPVPANPARFVLRGGGFNSLVSVANAVFRTGAAPVLPRSELAATGFRCAMNARQ
jgi:formylglycine-generating enzyme required for sulfatase activity